MCGPVATVASAALSVLGTLQQARQQSQLAKYNAAVARNQALATRQTAAAEEERLRRQTARLMGQRRAAIGAAGVTAEGTPLELMADEAGEAALDIATRRHEAELRGRGLEDQARLEGWNAKQAGVNAALGVAGTLLDLVPQEPLGGSVTPRKNPWKKTGG